ncbi:hypothetical protein JZ751_027340 [Albula glossodonta]|uniref:Uncharacterized protein n=1 Tax=Albula glossodonta TaxID=121402 RepID=A0A8T2NC19_9TELE|nr:hypothetical protein JZ751_027340 [Albula glossodonta]
MRLNSRWPWLILKCVKDPGEVKEKRDRWETEEFDSEPAAGSHDSSAAETALSVCLHTLLPHNTHGEGGEKKRQEGVLGEPVGQDDIYVTLKLPSCCCLILDLNAVSSGDESASTPELSPLSGGVGRGGGLGHRAGAVLTALTYGSILPSTSTPCPQCTAAAGQPLDLPSQEAAGTADASQTIVSAESSCTRGRQSSTISMMNSGDEEPSSPAQRPEKCG